LKGELVAMNWALMACEQVEKPELGTRKIQSTSCKTGVVSCRVDQEVPDRNRRTACRAGSTPIEGGEI
jgi:hypothetical protein